MCYRTIVYSPPRYLDPYAKYLLRRGAAARIHGQTQRIDAGWMKTM